MKNILDQIKAFKKEEITHRKQQKSLQELQSSPLFTRKPLSLRNAITKADSKGIIAEFKRQSPSKGIINPTAEVQSVTKGYQEAGAAGVSILYDQHFFGAQPQDFEHGRAQLSIPLLQKDFILDEYQITEAKAIGADVVLLIAKMLSTEEVKRLTAYAHLLDLEVLLETHNEEEIIAHQHTEYDLIGINNRNLQSFDVTVENSIALAKLLPPTAIKIAESGLQNVETIHQLRSNGFQGFLIGEYFMRDQQPASALKRLMDKL